MKVLKQLMKHLFQFFKAFPFTTFIIVVIWIVCLIPIPENPLSHISLIDKKTHIFLYTLLGSIIWLEYLKRHHPIKKYQLLTLTFLGPWLMSGIIEIVQETCTSGNRSGDWFDFIANGIGLVLAGVIGILLAQCFSKPDKDA